VGNHGERQATAGAGPQAGADLEAGARPDPAASAESSAHLEQSASADSPASAEPQIANAGPQTTDAAASDAAASDEPAADTTPDPAADPADPADPTPDPADPADPAEGATEPKSRRSWLTELVLLVVLALLLTVVVKAFLVQPFRIPSQSMENTLQVNDKVLVDKLVGHVSQIQRGEIIVFDGTGSWNPPARARRGSVFSRVVHDVGGLFVSGAGQTYYIKRVIGLPGDHVSCCNAQGLITVNGVALHESAYLYPGSQPSAVRFNIVVPPGRLWVMGDNRADSQDSRFFMCGVPDAQCNSWDRDGTIPENMVVGRAFMIVWPPSRVRLLSVPPTFSQAGLSTPRHRGGKSRPHEGRTTGGRAPASPATGAPAATAGAPASKTAGTSATTTTAGATTTTAGAGTSATPAGATATTAGTAAGASAIPDVGGPSSDGLLGLAAAQGIKVVPASPLPLWFAGVGLAVPLTLIERTVRLRRGRKRRRRSRADLAS
jgi:signal peptidase I